MPNAQWSTKRDFKFSAGPWNLHPGADPFGPPVRGERSFAEKLKIFKDLCFEYVQFHDDDAVPDEFSSSEREKRAKEVRKMLDDHGLKAEICAPRHWEHKHGIDGPVTSNDESDRKWAIERGKRCIDVARVLGMKVDDGQRKLMSRPRSYIIHLIQLNPGVGTVTPGSRAARAIRAAN